MTLTRRRHPISSRQYETLENHRRRNSGPAGGSSPVSPNQGRGNKKPNILFIITDDHAYQTLGTGKDDSPVALPNFNKLGRQGMVLTAATAPTPCAAPPAPVS